MNACGPLWLSVFVCIREVSLLLSPIQLITLYNVHAQTCFHGSSSWSIVAYSVG
jgi:hypothetical protein